MTATNPLGVEFPLSDDELAALNGVPLIETEGDLQDLAESFDTLEDLLEGIEAFTALQNELGSVHHRDSDYWIGG